jgi:hypothetical protein
VLYRAARLRIKVLKQSEAVALLSLAIARDPAIEHVLDNPRRGLL